MKPVVKKSLNLSVRSTLNDYIRSLGESHDTKLPPELEIAKSLNVSRATLRRTLDDMESEGLVLRIHGKGTFVNPEAVQIKLKLVPGHEFQKIIRKSGYATSTKVIRFEIEPADKQASTQLRVPVGTPLYVVEKAYFADAHLAIISVDRFPQSLLLEGESLTKRECSSSIFELLHQKAGRIVARDKIEMESLAREELGLHSRYAENMECASCLVFHGINYDQNNEPVIYDTELYDTTYIRFSIIRNKTLFD